MQHSQILEIKKTLLTHYKTSHKRRVSKESFLLHQKIATKEAGTRMRKAEGSGNFGIIFNPLQRLHRHLLSLKFL